MADELYRQCRLHKPPNVYTYTWLPISVAREGKSLVLHDDPGWLVEEVYNETRTKAQVFIAEDIHRRNRETTDI